MLSLLNLIGIWYFHHLLAFSYLCSLCCCWFINAHEIRWWKAKKKRILLRFCCSTVFIMNAYRQIVYCLFIVWYRADINDATASTWKEFLTKNSFQHEMHESSGRYANAQNESTKITFFFYYSILERNMLGMECQSKSIQNNILLLSTGITIKTVKIFSFCFKLNDTQKVPIIQRNFELLFISHWLACIFHVIYRMVVLKRLPMRTARPNSSVSSIPCLAKWRHVCV